MINKARDCIQSVSKSKLGCAMLDLDFVAAFDFQVFSEAVISCIAHLYEDCITIPVVNNVHGRAISNRRENLRQGGPGSMGWFSIAIDPLLIYLDKRLTGIPICSLPTVGPSLACGTPPEPIIDRYTVRKYADDVKPA